MPVFALSCLALPCHALSCSCLALPCTALPHPCLALPHSTPNPITCLPPVVVSGAEIHLGARNPGGPMSHIWLPPWTANHIYQLINSGCVGSNIHHCSRSTWHACRPLRAVRRGWWATCRACGVMQCRHLCTWSGRLGGKASGNPPLPPLLQLSKPGSRYPPPPLSPARALFVIRWGCCTTTGCIL